MLPVCYVIWVIASFVVIVVVVVFVVVVVVFISHVLLRCACSLCVLSDSAMTICFVCHCKEKHNKTVNWQKIDGPVFPVSQYNKGRKEITKLNHIKYIFLIVISHQ